MQNSRKRKRGQQFDRTLQKQSLIDIDYDGNVNGNDVARACIGHGNPNGATVGARACIGHGNPNSATVGARAIEADTDITLLELLAFGAAQAIVSTGYAMALGQNADNPTLINLAGYDFEPCSGMTDRAVEYLMRKT